MKIGFIGLGIMGEAMATNIVKKHDDSVFVFDIVQSQVELLEGEGALACDSIEDITQKADVLISMVPTGKNVLEIADKIIPNLNNTKTWIDMSTIQPNVSIGVAKRVSDTGAVFLDAPVVKSKPAAIKGELGIYVGGCAATYEKIKHILAYMGSNIIHLGENGKGLFMKISHNMLVAQIQNGVNETISFATKNGIAIDDFVKSISYGGGQNFYLDSKHKAIQNNDFTTAFSVQNMHKDVGIANEIMNSMGVFYNGFDCVQKVYKAAIEKGFGTEDFSATYKLFE